MAGLTQIRPLFRSKMNALEFKEWKGGFSFDNIPATLLNNSYHIETVSGNRRNPYDQQSQDIEHDVSIRVFIKGFRNPADAIDAAMEDYEDILASILAPSTRLGTGVKNIYLDSFQLSHLDIANDSACILEIKFICLIIICT